MRSGGRSGVDSAGYILGLDLGSNSVGWAAVKIRPGSENDPGPEPAGILALGSRVFDSGSEGNIEERKAEPRGQIRRAARQLRKQIDRAARRLDFIYLRMQLAGLLPGLPGQEWVKWNGAKLWRDRSERSRAERSRLRHATLNKLDADLRRWVKEVNQSRKLVPETAVAQRLPYFLRTLSLDAEMPPHAVGRALFHLAQRRGFLSNRKADKEDDEDLVKVKAGIKRLADDIGAANARTLGEFLLHRPEEKRIRGKEAWTSRRMNEDEFAAIWRAQAAFNPALFTPELEQDLYRAIFRQRPSKVQFKFVGACAWEKNNQGKSRRRAPLALLDAQRFRLLQQVNHTRVKDPSADTPERPLTDAERKQLADRLESAGDLSFTEAKKLLGLKRTAKFNFEEGGEKCFVGNRTAAKLSAIFGRERWSGMGEEQRNEVVEEWFRTQKEETLKKRGVVAWGLDEDAAGKFSKVSLESGHSALSRQALAKLMPHMEKGMAYMEACQAVYGGADPDPAADRLPPVALAIPGLRNPTVSRILTELRRVVNALIGRHGKPAAIRVELARELRKGKKARQDISKRNRMREKERQEARNSGLLAEAGIANPSRSDVDKVLLFKECGGQCPYTGKQISGRELFGGAYEVEHIVPLSISLDDSFLNKTLCHREANRKKGNRTPYQAFGHDEQLWREMTLRLRKFPGGMANPKVRRFLAKDNPELEDFSAQQFRDTCHAAKEATKYLGILYGDEANRRIQAGRGGVTRFLRDEWDLNRILGDGGGKNREDHRHHAVDAIVIALTGRRAMRRLSEAAVKAAGERRRRFGRLAPPWEGFHDEVKEAVDGIIVSHKVSLKVSGPLHEATYYGPGPERGKKGEVLWYHIRKPLHALKAEHINADDFIVDNAVRKAVREKFAALPKADPKLFELPEHHPCLQDRNGRLIPIKSVRVRKALAVLAVGSGDHTRYAVGGNNHHAEVFAVLDERGNQGKLEWEVVGMFEAYRRRKNKEPIVRRDHGTNKKFLFSVGLGESFELTDDDNTRRLFTCCCTTARELRFVGNADARMKKDLEKTKGYVRITSGKALAVRTPRKLVISPLGETFTAND